MLKCESYNFFQGYPHKNIDGDLNTEHLNKTFKVINGYNYISLIVY